MLRKYNGIDRKSFLLFLKECAFRFNYGTPKQQLKTLRNWCELATFGANPNTAPNLLNQHLMSGEISFQAA